MTSTEPTDRWPLRLIVAAVAVRLVVFGQYLASPLKGFHRLDQTYYLAWARRIAAGDWLGSEVFEQGPLYPYLLAIVFRLFGDRGGLILVAQMLLGATFCLLIYASARRLFDQRTAVVAGFIAAVYGPFIFYECMFHKSFLEPLLTVAACCAAIRSRDGSRRLWPVVCGLCIGLACLLRESHVLLLVPAAAGIWFADLPLTSARHRSSRIVLLAGACLICLVPSAIRNYVVGREFVAVTAGGGEVFYMAHGPTANGYYNPPDFVYATPFLEHEDFRREAQRRTGREMTRSESSRFWFREAWRAITADPLRAARLTGIKLLILWNDFEVPDSENYAVAREFIPLLHWALPGFGWLAGVGLLGFVVCLAQPRRYLIPLGFLAAYAASIVAVYNFGRFRLGFVAIVMLFAARGITWLYAAWFGNPPAARIRSIGATLFVVAVTVISFLPPVGYHQSGYEEDELILKGVLFNRARQYAAAESALSDALKLIDMHRPRAATASADLSRTIVEAQLAETMYRTVRFAEAQAHFESAVAGERRDEVREEVLRNWVLFLHDVIRRGIAVESIPDLHLEVRKRIAQLCAIAPASLEYQAQAAWWLDKADESAAATERLNAAWRSADQSSPFEQSWHQFGLSGLARRRGDDEVARHAALQALSLWPDHPYRAELELLAEPPPQHR
jgi:4-amino-4-deoxy-L-arabinose transferase-like glycosyltransferase